MLLFCNSTFAFLKTLPFLFNSELERDLHCSTVKPIKETSDTFIVRIRLESRELHNAEPVWRGVIEHVQLEQSNKDELPVYFDHLDELRSYFATYLKEIGIKADSNEG